MNEYEKERCRIQKLQAKTQIVQAIISFAMLLFLFKGQFGG